MLLILMLAGYSGSAQTHFSITGNVAPNLDVKKVYLNYRLDGKDYQDSSIIVNNTYSFKGSVPEAAKVYIVALYKKLIEFNFNRDVAALYIDANDIRVNHLDSFSQIIVQGSKSQQTYLNMNARLKKSDDELLRLMQQQDQYMTEGKKEEAQKTGEDIDKIMTDQRSILHGFFLENISSPFAVHILTSYEEKGAMPEQVDSLFAQVPPEARTGPTAIQLAKKLEKQRKLSIGLIAPSFTQADTSGLPVSLQSFRGNYILIDFWASWCRPCRDENPSFVKAFEKFKDKGFHILSVSLDQPDGKGKWLKAIHDDQLNWTHVSDLQYWDNAVAAEYSIESIPQNFLLDPRGKIIAKNLKGKVLEKMLGEIYK